MTMQYIKEERGINSEIFPSRIALERELIYNRQ